MNDLPASGSDPGRLTQRSSRSQDGDPAVRLALDADLAFWHSVMAFGRPVSTRPDSSPGDWLEPGWTERLVARMGQSAESDPERSFGMLQSAHRAQVRVDLSRVHPSWLDRAAQGESPAVTRLLAGDDHRAEGSEIDTWVRTLATERLVGGEPLAVNDPPVIVALAGLSPQSLWRLAHAVGQAKLVLAELPAEGVTRRPVARDRETWYRDRLINRLGGDATTLRQWASREVQGAAVSRTGNSRLPATLGMTTMARLLAGCDPSRVRWALQHLPYPIAKQFRSVMPAPYRGLPQLLRLEETLLNTAWERLTLEWRVNLPFPAEPARTSDAH